ncbi:HU family DNA-binding protein [Methylobacterium sp. J-070]|uniref:HU family DNA-binding protein n=1 Tax=Methylobacterium sp. J-070 TaxID=2836650 RepID=UPI001FBAA553|nr:HU family DNA-binding protein [Methylobacterium sp. J-070]MCJ2054745.1 integration host factor subunit beta [Methylobacterium sp. J-070]
MIRAELVAHSAGQNPHLTAQEREAVVRTLLGVITKARVQGDRVELRDFGTFSVRDRNPRVARNPRTGNTVTVPARAHVCFRPGKGGASAAQSREDQTGG